MRILICTNAYPPRFLGGAELVAHEQARALLRRGHEVVVFAGDFGGAGLRHDLTVEVWEGVTIHRVTTGPEDYDPSFLNFLHPAIDAHFVRLLKSFDPHTVHCHNLLGLSVRVPVLAKEHGAQAVCTLHDYWGFCLRNTLVRLDGRPCVDISQCGQCRPHGRLPLRLRKDFIQFALDQVDLFIAPSEYLAERYVDAGLPRERIRVVPNGIDAHRFFPASDRRSPAPARLSFVGHLGAHKGVDVLATALSLLPPDQDFRLSLAGRGPAEDACRAQFEAAGLIDRVEFRGVVAPADMPAFYGETDVLIVPSVWHENQPVCIMEAMASGVPVVASRNGGIPELITDGENGLLFASGDAGGLAAAIGQMIADPARARAMGRRGRMRIEQQTYDRQGAIQLELYHELRARGRVGEARKPITGIRGPYDARLRRRDRRMLREEENGDRYLIPIDWLTAMQKDALRVTQEVRPESRWAGRARRWFGLRP